MKIQGSLFGSPILAATRPKGQLLKWIGNKQRMAEGIVSHFPARFRTYREPFVGSGAVLATLAPEKAVASDSFGALMEIWQALREHPSTLQRWYASRWTSMMEGDKVEACRLTRKPSRVVVQGCG